MKDVKSKKNQGILFSLLAVVFGILIVYFLCSFPFELVWHVSLVSLVIAIMFLINGVTILKNEKKKKIIEENKYNHQMKLKYEPFLLIKEGRKSIELRLNDEKRQLIKKGDVILFTNLANKYETILVKVTNIYRFPTFEELYKNLPMTRCGYDINEVPRYTDMEEYYSIEKQKQYGVLGIEFTKIK